MRSKFILALVLLPFFAKAQISTVTEAQKQQALQHVKNFCTLLTQWSNGQRTLDTKIYALCSGNDCSAYDDVSTNKETTMRNYLLGIQKKYPRNLSMQIIQPSIANSKIYYDIDLSSSEAYQMGVGGTTTAALMTTLSVSSYTNAFIVFDVKQTLSSLGKSTNRKIVYDVNSRKITAFIIGNGTYISYLEGIECLTKQDYQTAITKFIYAAKNNRSSLRNTSYKAVTYLYALQQDYTSAAKYAELAGDQYILSFVRAAGLFITDKYDESLPHLLKCESIINTTKEYRFQLPVIHHLLGLVYAMPEESARCHNSKKALAYLKKSANEGFAASGWFLYFYQVCEAFDQKDMSEVEALKWLSWSAENGYPPAYYSLGRTKEYIDKNKSEAIKWYTKAAEAENPVAMACLGKMLIEKGGQNVASGKKWLRKSLEGNLLEKFLSEYRDGPDEPIWPTSRSDVQAMLNSSMNPSISSHNTSSTSASHHNNSHSSSSSQTTSSSSSTNNSTNNYSYKRKYHQPFNEKKDNYAGGFSVGYIQKQWTDKYDNGEKIKYGMFDDDNYLQGIQAGFRIDPQFVYGIGINTGIFYEYCWAISDEEYDKYGSYHITYEEHGLYLPIHLKYTMNFSEWFQFSLYGGIGLNYILSGKAYLRDDGETYGTDDVFEGENMKKFNVMLEYGAAIRIKRIQFNFSISNGLTNWSEDNDYKMTQGRPMSLSMTICL